MRQRYDKLEQKDLPGVISTASTDTEEDADDSDDSENADNDADDDDSSEPAEASMQQVSYQVSPRPFRTFNAPVDVRPARGI